MLSYDDVIFGRLLLHEGSVSTSGLWSALRGLLEAEATGAELSFTEALARGPLATLTGAQTLERTRRNQAIVLRVEVDRTLARLVFQEQLVPEPRIRDLYARIRQSSFRERLSDRLVGEGLLTRERVDELQARVEASLTPARVERRQALEQLLGSLAARFTPEEGERIRRVFELVPEAGESGAASRPITGPATAAPVEPARPHLREKKTEEIPTRAEVDEEVLAAAGETTSELDPEECPIYGYKIIEELGKGSMGVVYKAKHIFSKRVTALKILPLRLAAKTQYLERFKREAMALMRIRHENVVEGIDFGGSEEYYYLALEFVEGETLDEILKREGKLPERRALQITRQIALGLSVADQHGIVHRDIKPENVMLTQEGIAKICDFGIVKLSDLEESGVTMAGTTVGTPFYISPEQARGEDELDIGSDIYSLGISLFHLTTGRVPFTGKSQGAILVRHILEEVPDPRSVNPDLSEDLARVVARMTRKKRGERYATAEELVADIDAVLAKNGAE